MALPLPLRNAAWLQIAFGGLGLLGTCFVWSLIGNDGRGPAARASTSTSTSDPPFLFLAMALVLPALAAGWLVLRGHRHALLALTLVARLQLLLVPVGTALGAYSLWAVRRATAVDENAADAPPPMDPPMELLPDVEHTAPALAMVAAVGAGFALVIGLGFWISGETLPADCDEALVVAFAVLSTITVVAFRGMQKRRRERERVSVCRR